MLKMGDAQNLLRLQGFVDSLQTVVVGIATPRSRTASKEVEEGRRNGRHDLPGGTAGDGRQESAGRTEGGIKPGRKTWGTEGTKFRRLGRRNNFGVVARRPPS